jgi:cell division initiation protein
VNISPLDIRKHEFKKSLRGYDTDEVTMFLEMVSIESENLIRDNSVLKEKVANTDTQLKKYHDIESTLRETLLSAQRAREETILASKKQAEVIIREAEVKAASVIEEGRSELSRLRNSFAELKIQKESYLIKIKAIINAQLEMLEKMSFPEEEKVDKNKVPVAGKEEKGSFSEDQKSENQPEVRGQEETDVNDLLDSDETVVEDKKNIM